MSVFDEKDYSSSDGMVTTVWGPMIWNSLHIMSFNYPVNPTAADKTHYKNYMLSLGEVLPCCYCRDNYKTNLTKAGFSPAVFKNRESFSKFVYNLHNQVNTMLGKPNVLTYEQVRDRFELFRARCLTKPTAMPEQGCTDPFQGAPAKCAIRIVPRDSDVQGFSIDAACMVSRTNDTRRARGRGRGRGKPHVLTL